ncbi:hypothetical protein [Paludibacterium purpuratum]|uniref:Uncharacterized protein n=1 Tax=Paludibacterium purpuratum TaxID=1144873 RepID=A0A4R7BAG0_9NEIS|nr:hypothetical protein [Paludibacterium purpuratum]TDR81930.1 hypothetical protein DFP86_10240 [Paludibacterium purpuratum]
MMQRNILFHQTFIVAMTRPGSPRVVTTHGEENMTYQEELHAFLHEQLELWRLLAQLHGEGVYPLMEDEL